MKIIKIQKNTFAQFYGVIYNIYLNFNSYIFDVMNLENICIMYNVMFFLVLKM